MTYNKMPAILAVFAIVASAGTLTSFNVFSTPSGSIDTQSSDNSGGMKMLGHLEIVAKDPNGNIKAYRQTDNLVTAVGKSCVGIRLFGSNASSTNGTNAACGGYRNTGKFSVVAIGTGTAAESVASTGLTANFENGGNGTTGLMNSTTGSPSIYSVIQRQFQANASASIAESGLFDAGGNGAAASGHMFARKTFTAISLNNLDTLTVTWRITYS